VAVQVRTEDGRRWGRSFYVDPAGTTIRADLASMRGLGEGAAAGPAADAVTSVLVVIDLTNAAPGRSGRLMVRGSALLK